MKKENILQNHIYQILLKLQLIHRMAFDSWNLKPGNILIKKSISGGDAPI